jgi:hypothetical protein
MAVTHIDDDIVAGELPGVKVKPVVWDLDLVAVDNLLLEDSVAVAQTVAPGRVVERSKTVKEAGSETAETTVSEGGVVLLLDEILDAETKAIETRLIRHRGQIMMVAGEHQLTYPWRRPSGPH